MCGKNLDLCEAFGAVGAEKLQHVVGSERSVLDDGLVDCQELIADGKCAAAIRNTCWDNARDEDARRWDAVAVEVRRKWHEVAQHQTHLLVHRSLDFDQKWSEGKLDGLHHRNFIFDREVAKRRVVAAFQDLLCFRQ